VDDMIILKRIYINRAWTGFSCFGLSSEVAVL
jgi:hypothetical protein